MGSILVLCSFVLLTSQASADSPFQILRQIFRASRLPKPEDLQLGREWFCSGDKAAAKGIFAAVSQWDDSYRFQIAKQNIFINKGSRPVERFGYGSGLFFGNFKNGMDSLRINATGNLIVEIVSSRSRFKRPAAISDRRNQVEGYLICQNPTVEDS